MMKKMKFLHVALGMMLVASCAAGCGGDAGDGTSSGASKIVKIGLEAKGYGAEHVEALVAEYNKTNTEGVEVRIEKELPSVFHSNQLGLGPDKCDIDIFFTLNNSVFYTQSKADGYHWADLSDVYDTVAEGYKESDGVKTIEDLLEPSYVSNFTFKDGKQYSIPYTSGVVGLLYNKTKWDTTNAKLPEGDKLVLPNTTDEMFALFDRIGESDVKNASGGAYAFSYSGTDSYMHFLFNSWWPQYLGETAAKNFLEGKDENGAYTADIYNNVGREYAFEVCRQMIMKDSGYVNSSDVAQAYNKEQLNFMKGAAFFSCNGDWLEREVSKNFKPGTADVELIRTPVMSDIVKNPTISADFTGSESQKDEKLSAIVAFIDANYIEEDGAPNETDAATLGVSLNTLNFIHHARLARHSLVDFVTVIPAYSKELNEAKDFLRFMYSKKGQDIVLQNTYGCAAPMTIDYSQMDYWTTATHYSKSRLQLISKSISYGNANNFPMQYLGGIKLYPDGNQIATYFGGDSVKTAAELVAYEYNAYKTTWADKMAIAGVSN